MNKLIFGRYIPGDSFIHRLDPRAKLLASFYFIGIIFLANNWQSYVLIAPLLLLLFHYQKSAPASLSAVFGHYYG